MLIAKGNPEKTLVHYWKNTVASQTGMWMNQRLMLFSLQSSKLMLASGIPELRAVRIINSQSILNILHDLLLQLDLCKSTGPDRIHLRILKGLVDIIMGPLNDF